MKYPYFTLFSEHVRHVLQGDKLEIVVLNVSGIRREYMELRKDWSAFVFLAPFMVLQLLWRSLHYETFNLCSVPFVVKQVLNYRNNFSLQWPVVYQTGMLWISSSLSMQQAKPNRVFFSKFNTSRPLVAWFTLQINAGPEIGKGSAVQFRCLGLVLLYLHLLILSYIIWHMSIHHLCWGWCSWLWWCYF